MKAGKINNLHNWYYIRPGITVERGGDAVLNKDYFLSKADVIKHLKETGEYNKYIDIVKKRRAIIAKEKTTSLDLTVESGASESQASKDTGEEIVDVEPQDTTFVAIKGATTGASADESNAPPKATSATAMVLIANGTQDHKEIMLGTVEDSAASSTVRRITPGAVGTGTLATVRDNTEHLKGITLHTTFQCPPGDTAVERPNAATAVVSNKGGKSSKVSTGTTVEHATPSGVVAIVTTEVLGGAACSRSSPQSITTPEGFKTLPATLEATVKKAAKAKQCIDTADKAVQSLSRTVDAKKKANQANLSKLNEARSRLKGVTENRASSGTEAGSESPESRFQTHDIHGCKNPASVDPPGEPPLKLSVEHALKQKMD